MDQTRLFDRLLGILVGAEIKDLVCSLAMNSALIIPGDSESLSRAAAWLRQQLALPEQNPIFDQFEKHFNCTLTVENRQDPWYWPTCAEFASEHELTMFLLRWS